MASSEELVDKYLAQREKIETRYNKDLRAYRLSILGDDRLPDLERGVLGMTGDPEILHRFLELNARLVSHIGQPLIVVEKIGTERSRQNDSRMQRVYEATGGVILGAVQTKFHYQFGSEERTERTIDTVSFEVPVLPVVSYLRTENTYGQKIGELYVNGQEAEGDHERKSGSINIGGIHKDYSHPVDQADLRPGVPTGRGEELLIGRREIYSRIAAEEMYHVALAPLLDQIEAEKDRAAVSTEVASIS